MNSVKLISYKGLIGTGSISVTVALTVSNNTVLINDIPIFETELEESVNLRDVSNTWDEKDILYVLKRIFKEISENVDL